MTDETPAPTLPPDRCPACSAPHFRGNTVGHYACHSWIGGSGILRQAPECGMRVANSFRERLREALGVDAKDDTAILARVRELAGRGVSLDTARV
jgi:hypothetical protein